MRELADAKARSLATRVTAAPIYWSQPSNQGGELFGVGVSLPAEAFFSVELDFRETEVAIALSESRHPLARVRLRSRAHGERECQILFLRVSLDTDGAFWVSATDYDGVVDAFCETLEFAPTVEGCPNPMAVTVQSTLNAYLGQVKDGRFELLLKPDEPLPASVKAIIELRDEQAMRGFLDLLAIPRDEIYADEVEALNESNEFEIIEDDEANLIEFCFDEALRDEPLPAFAMLHVSVNSERHLSAQLLSPERQVIPMTLWSSDEALDLDFESRRIVRARPVNGERTRREVPEVLFPSRRVALVRPDHDEIVARLVLLAELDARDARALPRTSLVTERSVFVSYRTGQDSETANDVVRLLEAEGVECWVAPRNIVSGKNWNRSIVAAIEKASHLVVLVSSHSIESEFVQAEVQLALNSTKHIVPLVIEPNASVGYLDARLEVRQRVEWTVDQPTALTRLLQALR